MKDNPLLGKLAMSAGGGLLGGLSGGQGSKPNATRNYGPAVQWNSPISPVVQHGGLLGPQQQSQPGMGGGGLLGGGMAGLGRHNFPPYVLAYQCQIADYVQ